MDFGPNQVIPCPAGWVKPTLCPYQEQALAAWQAFAQRGVICAPTGGNRMRLAIAALAAVGGRAIVLCPTRAHAIDWGRTLARWYAGPVGLVADRELLVEGVTVATFEGAKRHFAEIAHLFETVVVDEVHQCAEPPHLQTLQTLPAVNRLGLATPAALDTAHAADRLETLVGPVVCEVGTTSLVAAPDAKLETVCLRVLLDAQERAAYEHSYRPFAELYATFVRGGAGVGGSAFVELLSKSSAGRRALKGYRFAARIAAFPRAKRSVIAALLERHRGERTLVFTAFDEDASAVATDARLPCLNPHIAPAERQHILDGFRQGRHPALVSALLPSAAIDLPEANIAILAAGSLGATEYVQHIGRALRPQAGRQPLAYELVTAFTLDDRRARARARSSRPRTSLSSLARGQDEPRKRS